jgi:hypothetical protein
MESYTDPHKGEISFKQVFFPELSYAVSAGVAPFNASYVFNLDPKWLTAMCTSRPERSDLTAHSTEALNREYGKCSSNATGRPEWVPCEDSAFLAGGILTLAPQPNIDNNLSEEDTALVIPNTQGYQVEFGEVRDQHLLQGEDSVCALFGDASGAMFWCGKKGRPSEFLFGRSLQQ